VKLHKQKLMPGECRINGANQGSFISIQQEGEELRYRHKRSPNGKFTVAWQTSQNYLVDKENQVCLIENGYNVLWCEEFDIVDACDVSDNGRGVSLFHSWISAEEIDNRPSYLKRDSLVIIDKDQGKHQLKFGTNEEILAFGISHDGRFLIYDLQRYRPDDYLLVLYNVQSNKEEWQHRYPREKVIHELIFKDDHILVYAGPIDRCHASSLLEGFSRT